jgi:hypothetical protein
MVCIALLWILTFVILGASQPDFIKYKNIENEDVMDWGKFIEYGLLMAILVSIAEILSTKFVFGKWFF